MSEIIIFEDPDAATPVQVTLDGDTVWLTQAQMAELFQVRPQNITMHLKRIYADSELTKEATCKDFLQVQLEGSRQVERQRKFYNLDTVISVGYRVNAKRGVRFRHWATQVLGQHLLQGYTHNRLRNSGDRILNANKNIMRTRRRCSRWVLPTPCIRGSIAISYDEISIDGGRHESTHCFPQIPGRDPS
jgi:hypothetical protein